LSPGFLGRSSLTVEEQLCFRRRDHPDRLQEAAVVPPVDPFETAALDVIEARPRTLVVDQLGLEEPDHRLGERVVIRIASAADALHATRFGEALGVTNR
jgi:hypothetical protein